MRHVLRWRTSQPFRLSHRMAGRRWSALVGVEPLLRSCSPLRTAVRPATMTRRATSGLAADTSLRWWGHDLHEIRERERERLKQYNMNTRTPLVGDPLIAPFRGLYNGCPSTMKSWSWWGASDPLLGLATPVRCVQACEGFERHHRKGANPKTW